MKGTLYQCLGTRIKNGTKRMYGYALFAWNPVTGQRSARKSSKCISAYDTCLATDQNDKIYIINGPTETMEEYSLSRRTISMLDGTAAHLIQDKSIDVPEFCAFWDGYIYVVFSSKTNATKQHDKIYVYNVKEQIWKISETRLTDGPIGHENKHMVFAVVPFQ